MAYAGDKAIKDWNELTHRQLQDAFDVYLRKAQITFDGSGLSRVPAGHLWQRALLATGDYLLPLNRNRSFLTSPVRNPDSWKRFFRDSGVRRQILKKLWDALDADQDIAPQLTAVVANARDLEPWRSAVVGHPEVIDYCVQREIRQESWSQEIYLLRKRQMNGTHAELFSFALHAQLTAEADGLSPLEVGPYQSVTGAWEEPHFVLRLDHPTHPIHFRVESKNGKFNVTVDRALVERHDSLLKALEGRLGFNVQGGMLVCSTPRDKVHELMRQIAEACK